MSHRRDISGTLPLRGMRFRGSVFFPALLALLESGAEDLAALWLRAVRSRLPLSRETRVDATSKHAQ